MRHEAWMHAVRSRWEMKDGVFMIVGLMLGDYGSWKFNA